MENINKKITSNEIRNGEVTLTRIYGYTFDEIRQIINYAKSMGFKLK